MVAACRGVAEARRDSGREARFRASGGQSVRGEESEPMKKLMSGLAIAAIASTAFVGAASAQDTDTASTGNGGVSNANSNGGAVTIGETNAGNAVGSTSVINSGEFLTGEDIAAMVIAAILGTE
jgi:hypothetical protein